MLPRIPNTLARWGGRELEPCVQLVYLMMLPLLQAWNTQLQTDGAGVALCEEADCSDITITVTDNEDKNAVVTINAQNVRYVF